MGAGAAVGGASAWSAEGVWALTGTPGMIAGRSLALRLGAPSRPLPGPGFGREHAMEANEMGPWTGNQGGESLQRLRF